MDLKHYFGANKTKLSEEKKAAGKKAQRARAIKALPFVVEPMEKRSLLSSTLGWAVSAGSSSADTGRSVAVAPDGSVYVTGSFKGTADFDPGAGTTNLSSAGNADIFVTKYTSSGTFVWAKKMGGSGEDEGRSIVVDASGVYTTGLFNDTADFDPGAGTANLVTSGKATVFLSKLDPATGNYLWATALGGSDEDIARAVALDASGNVYVTGSFSTSGDFDPGAGTFTLTSAGGTDVFLGKYAAADGAIIWAKKIGGTGDDIGDGLAVDSTGAYITGSFNGTVDFDPDAGTSNLASAGNTDIFVAKYSLAAGALTWADRLGGTDIDDGHGVSVDSGFVYTTGLFKGTADFDPGAGTANLVAPAPKSNIFISKLDATTGAYTWATSFGGSSEDVANEIDVAGTTIVVTGSFKTTADFDPSAGTFNLTSNGISDVYVARYSTSDASFIDADRFGSSSTDAGNGVAFGSASVLYAVGNFTSTVDFDPGAGVSNRTSNGQGDFFLTQLTPKTVTLSLTNSPLAENGGVATITATLSSTSASDVVVGLGFTGTATNATDYTPSAASITILAGNLTGSITLTGVIDALDENDETVIVDITSVTNAIEADTQQVTASITDDDPAPGVSLGLSGSPLAENGGVATVTATLTAISGLDVTINLGFTGTALNTTDYTRSGTSIVIPAGSLTGSVTLTGVSDALDEAAETVIVDITSVTNGTETGTQQVTASITDDAADLPPGVALSLLGSPLAENGGIATVTATLNAVSGQDVTVNLGFTGTALNATDYTRSGTSIVILAGSLTGSVTLTGVSDALDEAAETVIVDITSVTNGTETGTQQVTASITDDPADLPPGVALSLIGSPLAENGGVATVTATLAQASGQIVTVNLGFAGTAILTTDYTRSGTIITIPAGSLTGSVTITGVSDALDEATETVIVDISSVTNGTETGTQQVTASITDDVADLPPTVTLGLTGSPLVENGGVATVTATLSAVSGQIVTVNLGFSGTAANVVDYSRSGTIITIPAGSLTGSVTIAGVPDALDEATETVVVDISSVTNGTESGTQQVTASITDDPSDIGPNVTLSIIGPNILEPGGIGTVTATLSEVSGLDVTVTLGFTGSATLIDDYTHSDITITIPAGSLTGSILLAGVDDATSEGSEDIVVDITSVTNGFEVGTQQVIANIIDDETQSAVTLSLTDSPFAENGGVATVTATLTLAVASDVTIDLGFTGTAIEGTDYSHSATSIVILAGNLTGSITLTGLDDVVYESSETVMVEVLDVINAFEVGEQQVTANIADDEAQPGITLGLTGSPLAENGGVATVTATLSGLSAFDTTVNLVFSGAAIEGTDFTASAASIVIPAGSLSDSVTITGLSDTSFEGDETVVTDVDSVTNGVETGTQQVTATITDDPADTPPTVTLSLTGSPLSEDGGVATVTATLGSIADLDVTVNLGFTGTALNTTDYTRSSASITIPAGSLTGSITLTGVSDAIDEPDETVIVDITSVTNGVESGTQQVTATVADTDPAPGVSLSLTGSPINENAGGATVTATLATVSGQDVTINLGFTGTATNATDYTRSGTSITIPAGSLTGSVTITSINDGADEPNETVIVDITTLTNGTETGTQQVTATILDSTLLAPSIPDLTSDSDTGNGNADNITTDHTPTFTGTAEAGTTVKIFSDGVQVGSGTATGGAYNITVSRLLAGHHNITATATDSLLNVSPISGALKINVASDEDFTAATTINFGGKTRAVYTDASGNTVTVSLKGPGTGVVKLAAAQGDAVEVVVQDTTAKSSLVIAVKGAVMPAQTNVGDILINGSLARILAKTTRLSGGITATGFLGGVALASTLEGQHIVSVGAPATVKSMLSLAIPQIADLTVDSITPVKSVKAVQWVNTVDEVVTSPLIGRISMTGALQVDLTATSQDIKFRSIGAVKAGAIGDIAVNAFGGILGFRAVSWTEGSINADWLKAIGITGNLGADITLRSTTVLKTLGAVKVGGVLDGAQIRSAGVIGAVSAGAIRNSSIFAGIADGVTALPTQASNFANHVALLALSVKGIVQPEPTFTNSNIAAFTIGKISLRQVTADNGDVDFGVATTNLKSYKRLTGDTTLSIINIVPDITRFPTGEFDRATDFVGRVIQPT